jgi:methionyl-tRNA synthetase
MLKDDNTQVRERRIITAALPYANGELHLGHIASTYLPSDIFSRYSRLAGHEVIFTCATDDYGTPILVQAESENKDPKDYVKYWNQRDLEDFSKLNIKFDLFDRTSSEENHEMAKRFFLFLFKKGLIYEGEVLQYYCTNCKRFLPDRYVIGRCPFCKAENQYADVCENCGKTLKPGELEVPRCAVCGSTPILEKTSHYFFALSKFSDQLKKWLVETETLQKDIKNYVLKWIEEGLQDWDITRDISWGIPIPLKEAKGKVLYGWFENHLCYISTTLKFLKNKTPDAVAYWNSAKIYHFIGKDIVYHHYLFLPAERMAEGSFKLPEYIPTRGHLLLHGKKFSKSRRWYVSLREFLESFPEDYLRFYLAYITPSNQSDVNFDWDHFKSRINEELIGVLGNFFYRSTSFIWTRYGGLVPSPSSFDELDENLISDINNVPIKVGNLMERIVLDEALKVILEMGRSCNQYFQHKAPWKGDERGPTALYLSVNAVRSLAILLYPFIPNSMLNLWSSLNLERGLESETWESARTLCINPNHKINRPVILFNKITEEQIKTQKDKLPKE